MAISADSGNSGSLTARRARAARWVTLYQWRYAHQGARRAISATLCDQAGDQTEEASGGISRNDDLRWPITHLGEQPEAVEGVLYGAEAGWAGSLR